MNDFLISEDDLRALEAESSQGSDSVKARNSRLLEHLEQVKRAVDAWEKTSNPTTRQEGREILLKQLDDLKLLLKQNLEIERLRSRQRELFQVVLRDQYQRLTDKESRLALENLKLRMQLEDRTGAGPGEVSITDSVKPEGLHD